MNNTKLIVFQSKKDKKCKNKVYGVSKIKGTENCLKITEK